MPVHAVARPAHAGRPEYARDQRRSPQSIGGCGGRPLRLGGYCGCQGDSRRVSRSGHSGHSGSPGFLSGTWPRLRRAHRPVREARGSAQGHGYHARALAEPARSGRHPAQPDRPGRGMRGSSVPGMRHSCAFARRRLHGVRLAARVNGCITSSIRRRPTIRASGLPGLRFRSSHTQVCSGAVLGAAAPYAPACRPAGKGELYGVCLRYVGASAWSARIAGLISPARRRSRCDCRSWKAAAAGG